jgi:hypothetical protein
MKVLDDMNLFYRPLPSLLGDGSFPAPRLTISTYPQQVARLSERVSCHALSTFKSGHWPDARAQVAVLTTERWHRLELASSELVALGRGV